MSFANKFREQRYPSFIVLRNIYKFWWKRLYDAHQDSVMDIVRHVQCSLSKGTGHSLVYWKVLPVDREIME
jgi:hypothetical protein